MRTLPTLLFAILTIAPAVANAQLNKCTGADGKVTYQSEACPTASKAQTVQSSSAVIDPAKTKGWDPVDVERMRSGCVSQAMTDARTAYERDAKGKIAVAPFPVSDFRASVEPYCACLVVRVASAVLPKDVREKGAATLAQFSGEALRGGHCKPTGIMADTLGF